MLTYRFVDDGYYCCGYWIEDENGRRFADTFTEDAAREIVDAVNAARQAQQV